MTKPPRYEIHHDKVRIKADDPRQWLVYDDEGTLRASATSEQSAKDFVAIAIAKAGVRQCSSSEREA